MLRHTALNHFFTEIQRFDNIVDLPWTVIIIIIPWTVQTELSSYIGNLYQNIKFRSNQTGIVVPTPIATFFQ